MPRSGDRARDRELVLAVRAGDQLAFGRLFDAWFDRVYDLARRIVRDPDRAADVAQDAFLTAWRRLDELDDPAAFGGWLLRIARNRALDVVRRPGDRPASAEELALMGDEDARGGRGADLAVLIDPAQVAADASIAELVWAAADGLGERDAQVLDLHVRHGLEPAEIANVLGVNRVHAAQLVSRARKRLDRALQARVLWNEGAPKCAQLEQVVERASSPEFGPDLVAAIDRHARRCGECGERLRTRLSAVALFGAVPVLAPPQLRARTVGDLGAAGVPMQGAGSSPSPAPGPPAVGPRRRGLVVGGIVLVLLIAAAVLWWAVDDQDGTETVAADESSESSSAGPTSGDDADTSTSTTGVPTSDTVPQVLAPPTTAGAPPASEPPQPSATLPPAAPVPGSSPVVIPPPPSIGSPAPPPPDLAGPSISDSHQVSDCAGLFCLRVLSSANDSAGVNRIEIYFAHDTDALALVRTCLSSPCNWSNPTGYDPGETFHYRVRARDGAGNWSQTPVRTVVI